MVCAASFGIVQFHNVFECPLYCMLSKIYLFRAVMFMLLHVRLCVSVQSRVGVHLCMYMQQVCLYRSRSLVSMFVCMQGCTCACQQLWLDIFL